MGKSHSVVPEAVRVPSLVGGRPLAGRDEVRGGRFSNICLFDAWAGALAFELGWSPRRTDLAFFLRLKDWVGAGRDQVHTAAAPWVLEKLSARWGLRVRVRTHEAFGKRYHTSPDVARRYGRRYVRLAEWGDFGEAGVSEPPAIYMTFGHAWFGTHDGNFVIMSARLERS